MPYLREELGDLQFKPDPTEPETYFYEAPAPAPRPTITGRLPAVTMLGLGDCILDIYHSVEGSMDIINPIDTAGLVPDCRARLLRVEESKIQVSVQNLVEEMIDMVEDDGDIEMMCEDILESVICNMFGVEPPTEPEKVAKGLVAELVEEAVEAAESRRVARGATRPPGGATRGPGGAAKAAKKHFSIFDEIPEELIEKRRSSRKVLPSLQVRIVRVVCIV